MAKQEAKAGWSIQGSLSKQGVKEKVTIICSFDQLSNKVLHCCVLCASVNQKERERGLCVYREIN